MKPVSDINKMPEKIREVIELWKVKKELYRDEWEKNGGWPAKDVEMIFEYAGQDYSIRPEMIGLEQGLVWDIPWDEGFFEYIDRKIAEDLKAVGASDFAFFGDLD